MKISIVGAGYVGLITGLCLARLKNEVTLIDVDKGKIKAIADKKPYLYEDGLEELFTQVQVQAASDYRQINGSDLVFICIGTPSNEDGSMSIQEVHSATKEIARLLKTEHKYCVIVMKSTVLPGTTEEVVLPGLETSGRKAGLDFGLCMSPEFLREGKAIHDFMNPSRIVIGEYDRRSGDVLQELYRDFRAPVLRTSIKVAEMIKLASNAFLATKISFINEIGNICKTINVDTCEVAKGMGYDERIGSKFLNAGIGFGGSCLPKDLKALISKAKDKGYRPEVLESVLNLNRNQALRAVEMLKKHISIKGAAIGLLGLSFKPGTDDIRESQAIPIVQRLLQEKALVKAYDPLAADNFKKLFPQIQYVSKEEVMKCGSIIIVTEWPEFNNLDFKGKIVIDGRRVLKATEAAEYDGICW